LKLIEPFGIKRIYVLFVQLVEVVVAYGIFWQCTKEIVPEYLADQKPFQNLAISARHQPEMDIMKRILKFEVWLENGNFTVVDVPKIDAEELQDMPNLDIFWRLLLMKHLASECMDIQHEEQPPVIMSKKQIEDRIAAEVERRLKIEKRPKKRTKRS
jgi:hypothetical protein